MLCCPACRSTDIFWVTGGNLGQVYQCKACGYRGSFVLEIDPEGSENDDTRASPSGGDRGP
ncbi:MAG: hypothetical protein LUQ25_00325 [Methanoregulaceae archaeon]|nr:hypothetical protein [Methanoregulaceae archaeon]